MARRGIFVAPFEGLSEPRLVADLAVLAELRGWDGFFVWDHIVYSPPTERVADPWVVLSAVAMATSRLRIGPMVTPVSRRRVHKLARETVSLDRLSGGRLVLGVGLGADKHGELEPFGEVTDARERAALLDSGLDRLAAYWGGEFVPPPLQHPRIPIWVASRYPAKKPLERAARWDGLFPIGMDTPAEFAEYVGSMPQDREFDLIVTNPAGTNCGPWADAGATWCLTGFGPQPTEAEVRAAIEAGP